MPADPVLGREPCGQQADDARALGGAAGGCEARLELDTPEELAHRLEKAVVAEVRETRALPRGCEEGGFVETGVGRGFRRHSA